ncbi:hypothetical protein ACFPVT_08740 [Corynebacterium choanae]|uniref:Uncharacterized protein n=1 Tax=Corynebacterium choanae TaxID=1862358 RepID=A0A3G6JA57_9CORY|nr:hypothetical protein [Corynebacterium choanae]AZA13350.1 hypothetical protein CCHOA_04710 [Corynebacterium choanae]
MVFTGLPVIAAEASGGVRGSGVKFARHNTAGTVGGSAAGEGLNF